MLRHHFHLHDLLAFNAVLQVKAAQSGNGNLLVWELCGEQCRSFLQGFPRPTFQRPLAGQIVDVVRLKFPGGIFLPLQRIWHALRLSAQVGDLVRSQIQSRGDACVRYELAGPRPRVCPPESHQKGHPRELSLPLCI